MAGASMNDIKLRIKSVESTMQITKAMQLVATSKLRRAKEPDRASNPYCQTLRRSHDRGHGPLHRAPRRALSSPAPRSEKRRCYVVIAGDTGPGRAATTTTYSTGRGRTSRDGTELLCAAAGTQGHCRNTPRSSVELLSDQYARVRPAFPSAPATDLPSGSSRATTNEEFDEICVWRTPRSSP